MILHIRHPPTQDAEAVISTIHSQDKSSSFRATLGTIVKDAHILSAGHPGGEKLPAVGQKNRAEGHHHQAPQVSVVAGTFPKLHAVGNGNHQQKDAAAGGGEEESVPVISGQRVVVLVSDTTATEMAIKLLLSILSPGKDVLHLVTVVPYGEEKKGRELCEKHEASAKATLVQTEIHVLVSDSSDVI